MIRIIIWKEFQEKIRTIIACLLIVAAVILLIISTINSELIAGSIVCAVVGIDMFFSSYRNEYVSDILIYDDFISIIHKIGKNVQIKKIYKDKIESFFVLQEFRRERISRRGGISKDIGEITIRIKTLDGETEEFSEKYKTLGFECPYRVLLELIKVKNLIPNFSYEVLSNLKSVKASIENFEKTGKTYNLLDRIIYHAKTEPANTVFSIVFVIIVVCIVFFWISSMMFN